MGKISNICNIANVRRTVKYIQKNGVSSGMYAAWERLLQKKRDDYEWHPLTPEERQGQEKEADQLHEKMPVTFSILVPAYETKACYMQALLESVLAQTWRWFELVIADASASDVVEQVVAQSGDERIRYLRLSENLGISGNSNAGLKEVCGEYTGLLDHDDLLTADALYEMAAALYAERQKGVEPVMLYSDEDKTDGAGERFYEPHRKVDFNYDLILSNNYICHFLMVRTGQLKETGFRSLYDGAQDYDLILQVLRKSEGAPVVHVPKVLYHWRCHEQSTAENPGSKMYAYEAGRKAVNDYCADIGLKVRMRHEKHLGFYRVEYADGVLQQRRDVGAVGGRLLQRGRVAGGALHEDGTLYYGGMPKQFSGYMHRAVLQQDVEALDIRFVRIRKEAVPFLQEAFRETCGTELAEKQVNFLVGELGAEGQAQFLKELVERGIGEEKLKSISLLFGKKLRQNGMKLLYDPRKEWSL
ncbi:MAG: glycosyltransferase [Lachnospiraceae bacterium]|nr:glycosyltransferase [Lachnospiraceae bacterium]